MPSPPSTRTRSTLWRGERERLVAERDLDPAGALVQRDRVVVGAARMTSVPRSTRTGSGPATNSRLP